MTILQIDTLTAVPVEAYYLLAAVIAAAIAFLLGYRRGVSSGESQDLQVIEDMEGAEGFEMTARDASGTGTVSSMMRERKKAKALDKGVVRWHLVGSAFRTPKYIKPERKAGGNIPEVEFKGDTYYFPDEASVPSEAEGVPVVVHREGESDPVNLRSGWDLAVDAGSLSEYLTLRVSSKKPSSGLLSGVGGYDSMEMLRYLIIGIVLLAVGWEVIGGA